MSYHLHRTQQLHTTEKRTAEGHKVCDVARDPLSSPLLVTEMDEILGDLASQAEPNDVGRAPERDNRGDKGNRAILHLRVNPMT